MPRFTQIISVLGNPQFIAESMLWESEAVSQKTHPFVRRTNSLVIY
jgi:hypothetical protein